MTKTYVRRQDDVEVLATLWSGPGDHPEVAWITVAEGQEPREGRFPDEGRVMLALRAFYGWSQVSPGDWVIAGPEGLYRCSGTKFEELYMPC